MDIRMLMKMFLMVNSLFWLILKVARVSGGEVKIYEADDRQPGPLTYSTLQVTTRFIFWQVGPHLDAKIVL